MPVVFAQPDHSRFSSQSSGGGGGGNLNSSALADIAAYKAQYADPAEFNAQAQTQANIAGAQIQGHLAAQEQAAQLEIQGWMQKQAFTQQDQQELARQQAAVSELQGKLDKGEITDKEFYKMAGDVGKRINLLTFKEQHTKNQALAEQRKQMAEKHDQEGQLIAKRTELYNKTFNDRIAFVMDPTAHADLAGEVRTLQPGLEQMNPAQFEAAIRQRAEDQGRGSHFYQEDIGKWKPLEKTAMVGRTAGTGTAGASEKPPPGSMSDLQHAKLRESIEKSIKHDAEKAEKPVPSGDDLKNQVDEKLREMGQPVSVADLQASRHPAEQKQKSVEAQKADRLDKIQGLGAAVEGRDDLSPGQKQAANTLVYLMHKFVQTHGIPKEGSDLKKKLDEMADNYKKIVGNVQMPSKGTKIQEAPAQTGDERTLGGLVTRGSLLGQAIEGAGQLDTPIGGGN